MKRSVWISLIVAGACILAGLACIAVGFGLGGYTLLTDEGLNDGRTVKSIHLETRDFDRIRIDVLSADVELVPSEDDKCRVIATDSEHIEYTVSVVEDTLVVRAADTRAWYEKLFSVSVSDRSLQVALPRETYKSLYVHTVSGDMNINVRYTFSEDVTLTTAGGTVGTAATVDGHLDMQAAGGDLYVMGFLNTVTAHTASGKISLGGKTVDGDCAVTAADLETASGSITVRRGTLNELTAQTSSGSITVREGTLNELTVQTSSGSILLDSLTVRDTLNASASSGEISLLLVSCGSLTAETSSGSIKLTDTLAAGHLSAETSSGSVHLACADAETLYLKTASGSVKGSLRTPKIFYTDTTSGSVDVPKSTEGGLCEIRTTSGSIRVTVASAEGS